MLTVATGEIAEGQDRRRRSRPTWKNMSGNEVGLGGATSATVCCSILMVTQQTAPTTAAAAAASKQQQEQQKLQPANRSFNLEFEALAALLAERE